MTALEKERPNAPMPSFSDILLLLFLFAGPILHSFLFIVGGASASGQLAKVYIAVAAGAVLYLIGRARRFIPRQTLLLLLLFTVAGVSFLLTGMRLGTNAVYHSELKAYLAMVVCVILLTLCVFWTGKTEIHPMFVLVLDVVVSVVSFLALFRSGEQVSGLVRDTSGLLYQNIAYYSASCFGMNLYLLKEWQLRAVRPTAALWVALVLLSLLQIFTCFFSGGRGGTVLVLVLMLYGLVTLYGLKQLHKGVAAVLIAALLVFVFAPQLLDRLQLGTRGLARTMGIFSSDFSDRGRAKLYRGALDYFLQRPVFGNGVGSYLVLSGVYSHNAVTDLLCETGAAGLLAMLFVLYRYLRRVVPMYHSGSLFRFLTMIFLCGFTMNLFSGYLWVNQSVWLPIAVAAVCSAQTQPS